MSMLDLKLESLRLIRELDYIIYIYILNIITYKLIHVISEEERTH